MAQETKDALLRKLEQLGEAFMSNFSDDEAEAPPKKKQKIEDVQQTDDTMENEEINQKEENKTTKDNNSKPKMKKKSKKSSQPKTPTKKIEEKKVTEFNFQVNKYDSIGHHSLDKKEDVYAFGIRQKKELKRKRHEEQQQQLQEQAKQRKEQRKHKLLKASEASIAVKAKDERQLEIDSLLFETKDFGQDSLEYQNFLEEEKRKQGKDFKLKKEYKNLKVLREERQKEKERLKQERKWQIENGIYNRRTALIERAKRESKFKMGAHVKMLKLGAPNDIGRAVGIGTMKPKAIGSVGKYKKGVLVLQRDDVARITGRKWYTIEKPKKANAFQKKSK